MIKTHYYKKKTDTSWEDVEKWYQSSVGKDGHYYHQKIIIPGILKLLDFKTSDQESILDLACGQGILARHLPENISYAGIDLSPSLIKSAQQFEKNPKHQFHVGDVTKVLPIKKTDFSHAAVVLALQNIEFPNLVFKNLYKHLRPDG